LDFAEFEDLANREKAQIMEHDSGPALVIAGPGAGKTTILADKLIDLCQENDSRNIYAITFTNLAAGVLHPVSWTQLCAPPESCRRPLAIDLA